VVVSKNVGRLLATVAVVAAASMPALGEDDFPIVGTYTKDQICTGNGADRADLLVKITRTDIQSTMGSCTILHKQRSGRTISAQVECKMAGDQTILGDVTFTQRDDDALDFNDQDHTSPAVLYRCGQ
jgi:hypothetical protein